MEGLRDCFLEVSDLVGGRTKGPVCCRKTWWWNEYTEKVVQLKKGSALFGIKVHRHGQNGLGLLHGKSCVKEVDFKCKR